MKGVASSLENHMLEASFINSGTFLRFEKANYEVENALLFLVPPHLYRFENTHEVTCPRLRLCRRNLRLLCSICPLCNASIAASMPHFQPSSIPTITLLLPTSCHSLHMVPFLPKHCHLSRKFLYQRIRRFPILPHDFILDSVAPLRSFNIASLTGFSTPVCGECGGCAGASGIGTSEKSSWATAWIVYESTNPT